MGGVEGVLGLVGWDEEGAHCNLLVRFFIRFSWFVSEEVFLGLAIFYYFDFDDKIGFRLNTF